MDFDQLIGNKQVKEGLLRLIRKGQIGHSYLFTGPSGIGKSFFAKAFAGRLLEDHSETHPDLHMYRIEGKLGIHSIAKMRGLSEEVFLAPFSASST